MAERTDLEIEGLLYAIGLRHNTGKQLADHGTESAYKRHLRWGEDPCEPCRQANRDGKKRQREHPPAPNGRARPIKHGTRGGYSQHRYRKEQPCEACSQAYRDYQQVYRDQRRAVRLALPEPGTDPR